MRGISLLLFWLFWILVAGRRACTGDTQKEVDYIFDLDDETYTGLHIFAKIVATALKKLSLVKRLVWR